MDMEELDKAERSIWKASLNMEHEILDGISGSIASLKGSMSGL
jgi:hypothetical protein